MSQAEYTHQLQQIRNELGLLPKESNAHKLSKVRDFSLWIGCSESLIRNVEKGVAKLSPKMASVIERKTGVSKKWMLDPDAAGTAILDHAGRVWSAKRLDPFCYLPNLYPLLISCPTLLPSIIARLLEAQMLNELHQGRVSMVISLINRLAKQDFFEETDRGGLHHDPLSYLEPEGLRAELKAPGMDLLRSRSEDLDDEQYREMARLAESEPSSLPPGSKLNEIYRDMERLRHYKRFPKSKRQFE